MANSWQFDGFELFSGSRTLLLDGRAVAIGARAFDVLQALIERRDRLVGKEELLEVVWTDVVVEENNLQVQISALRKLLGPQAIATVPGRGYRFVRPLAAEAGDADGTGSPAAAPQAAAVVAAASRNNLPAELPLLFGRDEDVRSVEILLGAHRLVTLVGAGGIGKSRLAQAAAHASAAEFPDGAWMVELAGLSDPALVPSTVAQALAIPLPGQASLTEELMTRVDQRHLLLVIDNCEHLLDAVADLVQAILRQAPGITVLATSQEPLHLPAEQQYRLSPLAIPAKFSMDDARGFAAVALFESRVRAADPRFALNDEGLSLTVDICRRLDGLPLAIELAAARVATIGLRPVRDKLDARFRLLTGGARARLRRHQTLRAALEWSHSLLSEAEQVVFRRLGVFAGGFTIGLAQAVASDEGLDEWAVLDQVSALVDKSLVVADAGDNPRYRLLESARAYALEQLAAHEMAPLLRQHAVAMRAFLQRIDDANLDGEMRTDQYAAAVLPELDNLRAAYGWATGEAGDPEIAIAIAAHAGALIDYAADCVDWLLPLQQQVEAGVAAPPLAARYWRAMAAGNMASHVPRTLRIEAAGRARTLYAAQGQPRRVFSSLIQLARHLRGSDPVEAQAITEEARRLLAPDWPLEFRIHLHRNLGFAANMAGRADEALVQFSEAVRLSAATGDRRLQAIDRSNLVDLLWNTGPMELACEEGCRLAEELRAQPAADADMAVLFANLLGILSEMGRLDEAAAVGTEVLPMLRRVGILYVEEWAYFYWRRGQPAIAAQLVGASDAEIAISRTQLQPNEQRLIAEARAALATHFSDETLAGHLAAGGAMNNAQLLALITAGLA